MHVWGSSVKLVIVCTGCARVATNDVLYLSEGVSTFPQYSKPSKLVATSRLMARPSRLKLGVSRKHALMQRFCALD